MGSTISPAAVSIQLLHGVATPASGRRNLCLNAGGEPFGIPVLQAILLGVVMLSLSRLMRVGYILGLCLALSLLLSPNTSKAQIRAAVNRGSMPLPPMMLPLNNALTDSTGSFNG